MPGKIAQVIGTVVDVEFISLFQFFSLIFPARANQVEGWGRTEEPKREGREGER